jgi:hypothetical protein
VYLPIPSDTNGHKWDTADVAEIRIQVSEKQLPLRKQLEQL